MHMIEESESREVQKKLNSFAEGHIGGMNAPIGTTNGVTLLLKHWLKSDDELRLEIVLPKRVPQPEPGQPLSEHGDHFERIVEEFNSLLTAYGYEKPDSYIYEPPEEEPVFEQQRYRFKATIPNPRN